MSGHKLFVQATTMLRFWNRVSRPTTGWHLSVAAFGIFLVGRRGRKDGNIGEARTFAGNNIQILLHGFQSRFREHMSSLMVVQLADGKELGRSLLGTLFLSYNFLRFF